LGHQAVFAIVDHYRTRRRTNKLLRHAFELADLPLEDTRSVHDGEPHPVERDKNADPFTAVIRCTCGDAVDSKMISKWARALRYVVECKERGARLKAFMKQAGGVNACAARYAKSFG
jgi:hypothetical protein